jgi:hypothetical protein
LAWKDSCVIENDGLRHEILTLGLEDDIPIWEVADACRASGEISQGTEGTEVLASALVELAWEGAIRVLVGRWDAAGPHYVGADEAEQLLADLRRYSSAEETEHDLERVYYVNVQNIAG